MVKCTSRGFKMFFHIKFAFEICLLWVFAEIQWIQITAVLSTFHDLFLFLSLFSRSVSHFSHCLLDYCKWNNMANWRKKKLHHDDWKCRIWNIKIGNQWAVNCVPSTAKNSFQSKFCNHTHIRRIGWYFTQLLCE